MLITLLSDDWHSTSSSRATQSTSASTSSNSVPSENSMPTDVVRVVPAFAPNMLPFELLTPCTLSCTALTLTLSSVTVSDIDAVSAPPLNEALIATNVGCDGTRRHGTDDDDSTATAAGFDELTVLDEVTTTVASLRIACTATCACWKCDVQSMRRNALTAELVPL